MRGQGMGGWPWAPIAIGAALLMTVSPARAQVHGFLLNQLDMAFYRGDEKIDCPEGRSPTVRESFLATQSPAERKRLQLPENSVEFEKKYKVDYVFDKDGRDICTDADLFDTPDRATQKLVQSKIAPGMDLDRAPANGVTDQTCAHDSFTSPEGEQGVDNQLFRAVACNTFWRGGESGVGDVLGGGGVAWVANPTIVLVRDVQSWQDDPEVVVEIAPAADKPIADAKQMLTEDASLSISDDPRYRMRARGKIEKGVLTTEPRDMVVPFNWNVKSGGEFIVRHMQLRVRLAPDGQLVGKAGGYRPIDNALGVLHVGGPGVASAAGVECASVRKTLRLLADGDPDPKTKQCTTVSTGMAFNAKPAFVFEKGVLLNPPSQ